MLTHWCAVSHWVQRFRLQLAELQDAFREFPFSLACLQKYLESRVFFRTKLNYQDCVGRGCQLGVCRVLAAQSWLVIVLKVSKMGEHVPSVGNSVHFSTPMHPCTIFDVNSNGRGWRHSRFWRNVRAPDTHSIVYGETASAQSPRSSWR